MIGRPMPKPAFKEEDHEIWRQGLVFTLLGCITIWMSSFTMAAIVGGANLYLHAVAAAQLSFFLLLLKGGPSRRNFTELVFLVSCVLTLACIMVNNQKLIESGNTAYLFEGYKLFSLLVALIAVQSWKMGAALIGACAVLPIAQYLSWPSSWREQMPAEPSLTICYVIVSAGAYYYQIKNLKTARKLLQTEFAAIELKRYARAMLSARDLSNTPLQTLKTTLELLKHDPEHFDIHIARLERVADRLDQLNEIFKKYEPLDELSIESLSSLETLQEETEAWAQTQENKELTAKQNITLRKSKTLGFISFFQGFR